MAYHADKKYLFTHSANERIVSNSLSGEYLCMVIEHEPFRDYAENFTQLSMIEQQYYPDLAGAIATQYNTLCAQDLAMLPL